MIDNGILNDYILFDSEDPEKNYALALEYWKIGQTGAASSFFLRAAERFTENDNKNRAYESLLYASCCFRSQKNRDTTVRSLILTALNLCPTRPEAYFCICDLLRAQDRNIECYTFANLALLNCHFSSTAASASTAEFYVGKYGLVYLKAVTSWWLGKISECCNLYSDLKNYHWEEMPLEYQQKIDKDIASFNLA